MEIITRRATLADAQALSELAAHTFDDTFGHSCTPEDMHNFIEKNFNLQQVQRELENELDLVFVAETGDQLVGYIRFMEDYSGFQEMKQWKALELKRIYVKRDFQGKGIAPMLMNLLLEYAADRGYEALFLGVWEQNLKAQKFYEKYGFKNSGYTHDFPIGNTPQTDYWMWKFL